MKMRYRIAIAAVLALGTVLFFKLVIGDSVVELLDPQGSVATQERDVIVKTVLIMLAAGVPMLILLYAIAWKYRAGNPKAVYSPDAKNSAWGELAVWALPAVVVAALATIAWTSSHALDPFAAIKSEEKPITIQVIALQWKWLFIYPEQHIATVNFIAFPEQTPVHFELTTDGPVSSFWIPQLGSQIYAMGSMRTQLNLIASSTGEYAGKNMEINGPGYSGMTFVAKSVTQEDFDAWVNQVRRSPVVLDHAAFEELAKPSMEVPPAYYGAADTDIFTSVLIKDMPPMKERGSDMNHM